MFSLLRPEDGVFHAQLADLGNPVLYMPLRKSAATVAHLRANLPMLRESRDALWGEFEELIGAGHPNPWSVLGWGLEVAAMAKARGVQHLHAHFATVASYVARGASAISGIPFSFTCHAKDIYRDTVDPVRFQNLARPASTVVTVCNANRRHIEANLAGDESLNILTLYNGVDLQTLQPPSGTKRSKIPLVLGVGRLVEKKGFHYLISAASALLRAGEKFRCAIVGAGEEQENLERLIAKNGVGDQVELLGIMTQQQVRELLHEATMIVLPCVVGADGNRDALPTVLLEALACGVPCISTPVGGNEEILDDGNAGILVPENDCEALESAIGQLLDNSELRKKFARVGRARAEELFDLSKNVARLADSFASAGKLERV